MSLSQLVLTHIYIMYNFNFAPHHMQYFMIDHVIHSYNVSNPNHS